MRALAIADGEHYAPVVRDALAALPYEFLGVWLAGGTEKLRGGDDYGVPVVDDLEAAIAELDLRGARWAGDIVESPWYRYRGLHDPEGNLLYVTRPDRTALGLAEPR